MSGILARFLPNFLPGLGAFANPWVLLAILGALIASFMFGVHLEAGRLEAFQAKVTAAGDAQNIRTVQRIKDDKQRKKEADDAYQKKFNAVAARNATLTARLRKGASGSVLPPVPAGSPSPERATFDRAELDRALRDFTAGTAELVGEGDKAITGLDASKQWAAEQKKAK